MNKSTTLEPTKPMGKVHTPPIPPQVSHPRDAKTMNANATNVLLHTFSENPHIVSISLSNAPSSSDGWAVRETWSLTLDLKEPHDPCGTIADAVRSSTKDRSYTSNGKQIIMTIPNDPSRIDRFLERLRIAEIITVEEKRQAMANLRLYRYPSFDQGAGI